MHELVRPNARCRYREPISRGGRHGGYSFWLSCSAPSAPRAPSLRATAPVIRQVPSTRQPPIVPQPALTWPAPCTPRPAPCTPSLITLLGKPLPRLAARHFVSW